MKISQLNIQSFGKWIDKVIILDDAESFQSFYGENESGKSTIQKFILYMLFGLPKKACEFYTPKSRAHISGEMTLKDGADTITLSRQNTKLTIHLADGQTKDEAWWQKKLKGMNRNTYEAIYAFAANDLMEIQEMKQDDLSEILISVGLTGSSALYDTEKRLNAELDKVYLQRGKKPELNQKLAAYDELVAEYEVEAAKEKQYHTCVLQLEKEKQALEAQNHLLEAQADKLQAINIKIQYFSEIESFFMMQQSIKAYQNTPIFPEQGIARWETLEKEKMPLQVEYNAINDTIGQLEAEQSENQGKRYAETELTELEQLNAKEAQYYQLQNQYDTNEKALYEQNNLRQNILTALNWTENHPASSELTFNLEARWQKLAQEKQQLAEKQKELETQHELLTQKLSSKEEMIDDKEKESLSRQEEIALENRISTAGRRRDKNHIKSRNPFLYTAYFILVVGLIIALSAVIIPQKILLIIAVLLLLAGTYLYWQAKKIQLPNDSEAQAEQNQLQYAEERLAKQKMLDKELTLLHAQRDSEIKQSQEILMKLEQIRTQLEEQDQLCANEVAAHPYLADFSLMEWLEVYRKVSNLNDIERRIKAIETEQASIKNNVNAIEEALNKIEHVTDFSSLNQLLKKQSILEERVETIEKELKIQASRKSVLATELKQLDDKQMALLEYAEVETEEAFREKAERYESYQSLKEDLAKVTIKLSSIFDVQTMKSFSTQMIEKVALNETRSQLEASISEAEEKQEALRKSIAELNVEINHLEKQEDLTILNFKKQIAIDEINEIAKGWAANRTELNIIQSAKQKYQEKYLNKVIAYTSNYFSKMTKGNYQNVFAPTNNKRFQVEDKTHIRYNVDELSQGTIDQLYIALRLAIAKVMHETHRLPILVDDAFVHFDDKRLAEGLALLQETAAVQQVLFFTCKLSIYKQLNSQKL